ncbi:MAG: hypothetical protein BAJALOKI1v1_1190002 [Promethearchaeota archaeon]|nr:MAG: hypothetical protein BAJALOKI1v1_1190002 [Candidatus Lokiarchaeota archaeon]
MSYQFTQWVERLLEEKDIDPESEWIEFKDEKDLFQQMPLSVVIDYLQQQEPALKHQIRTRLTLIDFHNGSILHFFTFI